jgi:hypothetical protein
MIRKKKAVRNKKRFQKINWIVFVIVVLLGIFSAYLALIELDRLAASPKGDEEQSRREFQWGPSYTKMGMVLLFITALLALGWKRLFPFNVPLAILLLGFYYEFFFIVFTTGWVGLQGFLGLATAVLIALIMIISYAFYLWFY